MTDISVRSDNVDVEQIMRQIRARIREEGLSGLVVAGVGLGNVTAGVADANLS
jgi:L-asparaginase/Glu-tRNA(Gln) amidotransferase subunit D